MLLCRDVPGLTQGQASSGQRELEAAPGGPRGCPHHHEVVVRGDLGHWDLILVLSVLAMFNFMFCQLLSKVFEFSTKL